jgi:hypothetical protein
MEGVANVWLGAPDLRGVFSPQEFALLGHLLYARTRIELPWWSAIVAELNTSLVKSATLASKKVRERMQLWQMIGGC